MKRRKRMSRERALAQLQAEGWADRVRFLDSNTATVALAARALGCEPAHIAKTLALITAEGPVLVLAAGDVKLSNAKFRARFNCKAQMIKGEDVERLVGHAPGGVCPFGVNAGVRIFCDISLKRFDTVYPACGDDRSAVRFTPQELFEASHALGWIDVTVVREPKNAS